MSNYKRHYQAGGHYFFTLVTYNRKPILTTADNIKNLKQAIKKVKQDYPFILNAIVVLPDHLHFLWKLPEDDGNFSTRVRLMKRYFSMKITTPINQRKEKEIWQRRFWEHTIRNEDDWERHMDYIHYNPVKHGYVKAAKEWPYSTFLDWVNKRAYDVDWGLAEPASIVGMVAE